MFLICFSIDFAYADEKDNNTKMYWMKIWMADSLTPLQVHEKGKKKVSSTYWSLKYLYQNTYHFNLYKS